mmetsp:Transcript_14497/g.20127  ORF Transcript_14497/g.20127 Transcript_14497/m.20127 type:complete len:172 (-) Transcript_14497:339-854(-)|eukprot:CAMPEP_0185266626 /NCGR_PEP_ID=MMETSP1359-20130426/31723_1 /TAXON_ID=552665 /ORGANISM="Bigelowiella longifila, Strain CCMP242" /LENGTH=171 /DNA_ID=CAMNT_0027856529 /DNA_START=130 /DNA_END=648 /DNA_ORIENTATION=+
MTRCRSRLLHYRSGASLVSAMIVLHILLTSQFEFNNSQEDIEMKPRRGKKNPSANRRQAKYSAAGVKKRIKVKRKPFKKDSRQAEHAKPKGKPTKTAVPMHDLLLGGQIKGREEEVQISDHDSEDSFYRDVRRSLERKKRNQLRIHLAAGPEVLKSLTKDYMSKEQQDDWR